MTTKDYQTKGSLRIFFSYFKPHRRLFLLDMSCAMLVSVIDLAFPLISRTAMYEWLPNRAYRTFFLVMAGVVAAYVLRSALNYIICYWGHTFGIRVEADIRRDLFTHMQDLGFDFYDRNRTGQLMSRLTSDLFDLTELAHHGPEDTVTSCITILGALAVMFSIQWKLALVVAVLIPIFALVVTTQRRRMSAVSKEVKQKIGHINTEIESSLSGIRTAKAFANESWENHRFSRANGKYKTSKRQFHKAMARFNSTMEFFLCSLQVVVIAFGGWLIMREQMDLVDLLTFSLYIGTFVNPMRKLANFSEMFASGFAGLSRFRDIMSTEPSQKDPPEAQTLSHVTGARLRKNPFIRTSALFSRTFSSLPTPFLKTFVTASPTPQKKKSTKPLRRLKSMTISWPCPTALTPMWANEAPSCPAWPGYRHRFQPS